MLLDLFLHIVVPFVVISWVMLYVGIVIVAHLVDGHPWRDALAWPKVLFRKIA
jgi:hypothetical protein